MGNTELYMLISIVVPISMVLFFAKRKVRLFISFFLLGIVAMYACGWLNVLLESASKLDGYIYSIGIAPIVEEIVKTWPIILFAFAYKPDRQLILEAGLAVGIGFAVLENVYMFLAAGGNVSLVMALMRAFGAGMMHGITTSVMGYGLGILYTKPRRMAFAGIIALMSTSIVYHSIYNNFVLSGHALIGFSLPTFTLILELVLHNHNKRRP